MLFSILGNDKYINRPKDYVSEISFRLFFGLKILLQNTINYVYTYTPISVRVYSFYYVLIKHLKFLVYSKFSPAHP